jgi:hypothetical protein
MTPYSLYKITLITVTVLTFIPSVFSQKQEEQNITLEMEFSPLGSEPLKINSLRGRCFFKENQAFRLSVFAGGKRTATKTMTPDSSFELTATNGNFDFSIRPGFEHHFDVAEKLSPYLGGEFYYGFTQTKTSNESLNFSNEVMAMRSINTQSNIGLNVLTGTDFYFSKKIYLGVELGFGLLLEGKGKSKVRYENQDPASGLEDSNTKGNSTTLNWGPNYQGTIRLGYCIK